ASRVSDTETVTTQQWICTSCGFIYDPAEGDPDGGIAPGTPFEDVPDDWFCPVCGARKRDFEPYEEGASPNGARPPGSSGAWPGASTAGGGPTADPSGSGGRPAPAGAACQGRAG